MLISRSLSVSEAALERPDDAAIVLADRILDFSAVAARSRRVASWLRSLGAERIAVVAALRVETVIVLYAAFEAGVPVVLLHPRLTSSERAKLLASAPASIAIDEHWVEDDIAEVRAPAVSYAADEDALAIVFTSGSSGVPKPVFLSRRAFAAAAEASAANLGWHPDDRWLLSMPLAHVGGLSIVVRCLIARKPMVLAPWGDDLGQVLGAVDDRRATLLSLVPTMLIKVFEALPNYSFPTHVRAVLLGGDRAGARVLDEAARRRAAVLTTYGLTEACSQVASRKPGSKPSFEAGVGPPLSGVEVTIRDGEILVRGPNLFSGYLVGDQVVRSVDADGWFATGDLGRVDDQGLLFVSGRKKDLIITGGENVDPREVEDTLLTHPDVASAAVFGVADEAWGELVAAAVVPRAPIGTGDLAQYLAQRLAPHKRPRLFVATDAFPLTASNKLDRKRLASALASKLTPLRYPKS